MSRNRKAKVEPGRYEGPRIVVAPEALLRLASGFDQLAAVMAVTLGPTQGPVLNSRTGGSVELLSDAGTIARRVVEIPDRAANTGAMIVRHMAWRMHEEVGDGAATAAVLARAMVREAVRRIEAGIDPMLIRRGLERVLPAALEALTAQAEPAAGAEMLTAVATGITGDPAVGAVLGEIVDLLGPDAALTIEELPAPYLDREYVEGSYWRAHPAARAMIPEGRREVVLERPLILIVDQALNDVEDVRPALEHAAQTADRRPLLIVPAKIGDQALAAIIANQARGTVTVLASLLSTAGPARTDDLTDLAVLTGGIVMADLLGRAPRRLRLEALGAARKAIISRESLTIVGGEGDRAVVAERAAMLRRMAAGATASDEEWKRLQGRLGRLNGGIAILKIGARVGIDLTHRRAQAEKAFRVLTGMLTDGVVPGGGVAYLQCIPAVQAHCAAGAASDDDHGRDVLMAALEAPFKRIVRNHGVVHPPLAFAEATRFGCGHGFDVRTGEYADMRERGILDSLRVTRTALQMATSAALSVITNGAVILPASTRQAQRVRP